MKRTSESILALAAMALAVISCSKGDIEHQTGKGTGTTVRFSLVAPQPDEPDADPQTGGETKSKFGTAADGKYPTLWTANKKVALSYNFASTKSGAVTPSSDGKTAEFSAEFDRDAASETHGFYSISPYDAMKSIKKDTGGSIVIPSSQTPIDGSCDESAQIIAAMYESGTFPTEIGLTYHHVTAYGRLSVTMPSDAGEISSISLTASENISGSYYYDFSGLSLTENSPSKTITLMTSKTSDIFFACAPADLSGGSLTVTVAAEGGVYEKAIDLTGKTLKFVRGEMSKFSVNMSSVTPAGNVVYTLVTDASTLKVGDKVIIAALDSDVAISTTQNENNRGSASVTRSSDKTTITNPGGTVQLFTLEKGKVSGTCAFNTGSGYICAASSSSNLLKTSETPDGNASWTVSVAATGEAAIVAQGSCTNNTLQYNSSGNLFSCYKSATQKGLALYTDGGGEGILLPPPITPEKSSVTLEYNDTAEQSFGVTVTGSDSGLSCSVAASEDGSGTADWLTAAYADGTVTFSAAANDGTAERTACIVFSASNSVGTTTVCVTVTQNAQPTAFYTKVTEISDGNYLMVYNGKAASSAGATLGTADVTITDAGIASTTTVDSYAVTITKVENTDYYTLYLGEKYIGYKSSTSFATASSLPTDDNVNYYYWTITFNDDGSVLIKNVKESGRFIGGDKKGSEFSTFKAYATSGTGTYPQPFLYKLTE